MKAMVSKTLKNSANKFQNLIPTMQSHSDPNKSFDFKRGADNSKLTTNSVDKHKNIFNLKR